MIGLFIYRLALWLGAITLYRLKLKSCRVLGVIEATIKLSVRKKLQYLTISQLPFFNLKRVFMKNYHKRIEEKGQHVEQNDFFEHENRFKKKKKERREKHHAKNQKFHHLDFNSDEFDDMEGLEGFDGFELN